MKSNIVIIKDDVLVRQTLAGYVEPARYAVEGFGSAEEFLAPSGASQTAGYLIVEFQSPGVAGPASGFPSKPFQWEGLSKILGGGIE